MTPASQSPGSRNAAAWFARMFGHAHALAPLPVVVLLLAPATVLGDIYKWTDEQGNTVISNVQPASTAKTSGMELLAKETRPAAPAAGAAPTRTEQALQSRIENLERQLQAQHGQGAPQPGYPQDYYPGTPSPAPDPNYYSGYDPNYYGSSYDPNYYSGYDPFYSSGYYPYGVPLAYSYIAVPTRPLHQHRFVNPLHNAIRPPAVVNPLRNANRSPAVVGQPPAITGRPPVFTGRPPVFVTRSQAFMSQPAPGFSRPAASAGGAMHSARR